MKVDQINDFYYVIFDREPEIHLLFEDTDGCRIMKIMIFCNAMLKKKSLLTNVHCTKQDRRFVKTMMN
ncbi:hypothetical protein C7J99_19065 [Brevibacillus brevis]|nr:hypothetical protein C7J99_19065 [Brevibacillus brevis]